MTVKYAVEIRGDVRQSLLDTLDRVVEFADAKLAEETRGNPKAGAAKRERTKISLGMKESGEHERPTEIALGAVGQIAAGPKDPRQLGKAKGSDGTPSGPGASGIDFIELNEHGSKNDVVVKHVSEATAVCEKTYHVHVHIHLPTG